MRKLTYFSYPAAYNLFSHFEVIGRLQIDPVLRRLAKGLAEKQGLAMWLGNVSLHRIIEKELSAFLCRRYKSRTYYYWIVAKRGKMI